MPLFTKTNKSWGNKARTVWAINANINVIRSLQCSWCCCSWCMTMNRKILKMGNGLNWWSDRVLVGYPKGDEEPLEHCLCWSHGAGRGPRGLKGCVYRTQCCMVEQSWAPSSVSALQSELSPEWQMSFGLEATSWFTPNKILRMH